MAMRTYDPKKVLLTVGVGTITGYADGTFIKVSRDEEAFTKKVGADGEVTRAKSNNQAGSIEITLDLASPSNDALSALATADELTNTGAVPVSLLLIGNSSGKPLVATEAGWVKKKPDMGFSKKAEDRTWVIDCAAMDFNPAGIALP